jgi:hypothetical protein
MQLQRITVPSFLFSIIDFFISKYEELKNSVRRNRVARLYGVSESVFDDLPPI